MPHNMGHKTISDDVSIVCDQVAPGCDADEMWIVLLWPIIDNRICISKNLFSHKGMRYFDVS
jgi:hypothetical protein